MISIKYNNDRLACIDRLMKTIRNFSKFIVTAMIYTMLYVQCSRRNGPDINIFFFFFYKPYCLHYIFVRNICKNGLIIHNTYGYTIYLHVPYTYYIYNLYLPGYTYIRLFVKVKSRSPPAVVTKIGAKAICMFFIFFNLFVTSTVYVNCIHYNSLTYVYILCIS